jgi:hypothetical protein
LTRDEWLDAFAAAAGVAPPAEAEIESLLELGGVAAHMSERTAAPITCWIAATAGLQPSDALALARTLHIEH